MHLLHGKGISLQGGLHFPFFHLHFFFSSFWEEEATSQYEVTPSAILNTKGKPKPPTNLDMLLPYTSRWPLLPNFIFLKNYFILNNPLVYLFGNYFQYRNPL